MTEAMRIHPALPIPPIVLATARPRRVRDADPVPRLARIACALAALALPVLGIATADTLHRVGVPRAMQAAAPILPLTGAAITPPGLRSGGRP